MNKLLTSLLVLVCTIAARAADVPVLNAMLTVGKESRFVLIGADGKPSEWLKLGDSFGGYALKAYDPVASALELEKDGKVTRTLLASDARVAAGGATAAAPVTLADAEAVLNKMNFEKMIERTIASQRSVMTRMMQQQGMVKNMTPEQRAEFLEFQKKITDEILGALNPSQMKSEMAQVFADVFTKQELDGLAAFYSTPVGEALNEKQPVIQQKMQEIMMPRMMALAPKLQQMQREFAAQQKAKAAAAATAAAEPPASSP